MLHKNIQVVDEKGQYQGLAKSPFAAIEAGQIRLLSRVVITDGRGNYLLQKRAKDMRMYPDCWDTSASGHVDEGESATVAAQRELYEEIGLKMELTLAFEYFSDLYIERYDRNFKSYSHVYKGVFRGGTDRLQLEESEVAGVAWLSLQQIQELIASQSSRCTDGLQDIFGKYLSRLL